MSTPTASDKIPQAALLLGHSSFDIEELFSERGDPEKRQAVENLAAKLAREKWRANYLAAPQAYMLDQACRVVNEAFGAVCYLVGSALKRKDYRDVDVRLMLDDEVFARMFPGIIVGSEPKCALWSLMCVAISRHLSEMSGLPVDFQIQQRSEANEQHNGERSALGMFFDMRNSEPYPGGG